MDLIYFSQFQTSRKELQVIFEDTKIVNAESFAKNAKATAQRSGRLGLSSEAATLLNVQRGGRVLIATCDNGDLGCVILPPESTDTRGFRWQQASNYFSANLKPFFDKIGLNYADPEITTIFDIVPSDEFYGGHPVFRLHKRQVKKRSTKKEELKDKFDS